MALIALVTPHLRLGSVFELTPELLQQRGLCALLLDLDRTLKEHYSAEPLPGVAEWLERLRAAGIKLCILSNGQRRRVRPLASELGLIWTSGAAKPLPFALRAAARRLGVPLDQTAIIGDQLFSDVLAGRLAGVFTILVPPAGSEEPWTTAIKRPLERWLLQRIERRNCKQAIGLRQRAN